MPAKRKPITDEQIGDALRAAHGLYEVAARIVTKTSGHSITRQGLERRIAKNPDLQEIARQATESLTDFAENKLFELIKAGDKTSIIFYLKCKGKNRGYIERQELTGKDGAVLTGDKLEPLEVNIKIIDPAGKVKRLED